MVCARQYGDGHAWQDLFLEQSEEYINSVSGENLPKIAIEAGIRQGWDYIIGRKGHFIGMKSYGAYAPGETLFKHFGITADNIISKVKVMLNTG